VASGIAIWVYRHSSQDVCPYNVKFAQELKEPAFAPREVLAGKDARTLARELLAMTQAEFSVAFKNSPMKRAKLQGLKRNATVVLGNLRTTSHAENADDAETAEVLARALDDPEPLVREHAAWALARLEASGLP
jgi:epoxyqueuosine reductase QueG